MSTNKTNNYSVIDVDKNYVKSNISHDQAPLINSGRYNVKKMPELRKSHTNQSNTLYGDSNHLRHRNHTSTDQILKNRYKSYDYLPARQPRINHYKSNPRFYQDGYNEYSDSGGDINETSYEALNKFRKSYSYGGMKPFSSNEELDNSHMYDVEPNHSSDSSRRYQYRSKYFTDNHNDYHRKSRHAEFENRKYAGDSWNYENALNYQDPQRYSRYSPATAFIKAPCESRVKQNTRGTSYPSYINNNKSDTLSRKSHINQLSSEFQSSRYTDVNNDNYSSYCKESPNRNMLSLKSTYRKNENIPHSGTRLENHRKHFDKYCTGRNRETRFNESNNCDDLRRHNSMIVNKSSKGIRSNLPPSPKYSATRKKYGDFGSIESNKYGNRESYTTPRRSRMFSNEHGSDNESCYFENCYNTNNECNSRHHKNTKRTNKDYCGSISDELSSSSLVLSQEKPTDSIALSISSPKLNSNIKSFNHAFQRSSNYGEDSTVPSTHASKSFRGKESQMYCNHSQKSSRHHNTKKHH